MQTWDSAAHLACRLPYSDELHELLEHLLAQGAVFDLCNKLDDTPLHEAAVAGESALIHWLVKVVGDYDRVLAIDAGNRFGDTPLHKVRGAKGLGFFDRSGQAVRAGNEAGARALLQNNADLTIVSETGTPADVAVKLQVCFQVALSGRFITIRLESNIVGTVDRLYARWFYTSRGKTVVHFVATQRASQTVAQTE